MYTIHLFITGTTFHYERKVKFIFGPESIQALGPTTEALVIVVSVSIIVINVIHH